MSARVVTMSPGELEAVLEQRLGEIRARQRLAADRRAGRRRRPRALRRTLPTVVATTLLALLGAVTVLAVHTNTAFELDGNTVNGLATGEDWNDVFVDEDTAVAADFQHDEAQPDFSHHEPSNADQQGLEDWGCVKKQNVNDKEDLRHAYAAAYDIGGQQHLFFGADRDSNNGSANIGVWFFQSTVSCALGTNDSAGDFTGHKTDGDLFIVSEFTSGGRVSSIKIYIWTDPDGIFENGDECIGDGVDCSAAHAGASHPFASGIDCQLTNPHDNPGSPNVCATVNTDGDNTADEASQQIDVPWETGANDPEEADFFEGGLNLTQLFPAGLDCFADVMIETRASFSISANLFDIVFLNFDTCSSITAVKYLDANGNGQDDDETRLAGWTMNLFEDENGNGIVDAEDGLLATGDTDGDGEVLFDALDPGDYIVCEVLESGTPSWINTDPGGGSLCEAVELGAADATVDFGNAQPDIEVTKDADITQVCAGADTLVTYTVTVTNAGNVELTNVDVIDDNGTPGVPGDDEAVFTDETLAPAGETGDELSTTFSRTINATTTNTVSASGDALGNSPADTDTDTALVTAVECGGALFLIIDEDSIDNGIRFFEGPTAGQQNIKPGTKRVFSDIEVNDQEASETMRDVLQYFADNVGETIALHTGQVGDEGWFAPTLIPSSWGADIQEGIANLLGALIPQSDLDNIPAVMPLRALGLELLEGQTVCALVYDSDISINYFSSDPWTDGNLQGATLGIVAFTVIEDGVNKMRGFSSSTLPEAQILIEDAGTVCQGPFELFDAPIPSSSSEPADIDPHSTADDAGYR